MTSHALTSFHYLIPSIVLKKSHILRNPIFRPKSIRGISPIHFLRKVSLGESVFGTLRLGTVSTRGFLLPIDKYGQSKCPYRSPRKLIIASAFASSSLGAGRRNHKRTRQSMNAESDRKGFGRTSSRPDDPFMLALFS